MEVKSQKSQTGSSGVNRYADYNGPTFNPNGHLVFELSPKNRFLTPNWPFMTLDHLTVLFENVPPLHLHLVPKYEPCANFLHRVITFFIFGVFCPSLPPPEIVRAPKTIGHIYSLWAISTPPYDICTMYGSWVIVVTSGVTHTHTHTHTYTHTYTPTPTGPHRFLMLAASEPKRLENPEFFFCPQWPLMTRG